MLTAEDNKLLTQTGPGTPMGELFRRFWLPFMLAEELPGPDCPPVRTKLLGEELIAFKDTNGRIGLLDRYCPHRGTELFFGRNEECGLRCSYHGWKWDVDGNCMDMPSEPPQSRFKTKVTIKSYSAVEYGGAIWAYMGPRELKPGLPQLPWAMVPASHRLIGKFFSPNNYAQSLEGDIDSSHVSFLHAGLSTKQREAKLALGEKLNLAQVDKVPRFDVRKKDYGLLIGARRQAKKGRYQGGIGGPAQVGKGVYYWRITQVLMPCHTLFPPDPEMPDNGHVWVPIDDENHWTWSMHWRTDRPLAEEEIAKITSPEETIYPEVLPDGSFRTVANADNDYFLDRELQKNGNFTGLTGTRIQDMSIVERMGAIMNRTEEHLGTSDTAIIAFRRMMLRAARDLQKGREPYAASHSELYKIRSHTTVLHRDLDWEEESKNDLVAVI